MENPLGLLQTRLHAWFMVLQDKSRPHVAGSGSAQCTKYEPSFLSMIQTWSDHESGSGQTDSVKVSCRWESAGLSQHTICEAAVNITTPALSMITPFVNELAANNSSLAIPNGP